MQSDTKSNGKRCINYIYMLIWIKELENEYGDKEVVEIIEEDLEEYQKRYKIK